MTRALATLLALTVCAAAQDVEKEAQRPAAQTKQQRQAAKASEAAAKLKAEASDEVTFEQVLAKPDDVLLNYAYALQKIKSGDLKSAATTLERILLVKPSLHRIRLLYAVVLYRLDDLIESQRQLKTLSGQKLPDDVAAEAGQYLRLVERALKKNQLSGRVGLGWQYDSNRNAAPATGRRLLGDVPINLTGGSLRRDDTSLLTVLTIDGRRAAGPHDGFLSASYYRAEQTALKVLSLQAYSLQGGVALRSGRHTLTPTLLFDHVLLAQSTYLRNRGLELRYDRRLGKRANAYFSVRDAFQDFQRTRQIPNADERDGIQLDLILGADYALSPKHKLGASFTHTIKRATQHYNQFGRESLLLEHIWLLGKGMFLLSGAAFNFDRYAQADAAISARRRSDDTVRLTAVYGVPLSLLHGSLDSLLATLTYEYYQSQSNIENYGYTNNRLGLMLTYKWNAGF